jgi:hypothetical protein
MAHNFPNNNRRTSMGGMPTTSDQIAKNSYEYELMKLIERERQFSAAQVDILYSY